MSYWLIAAMLAGFLATLLLTKPLSRFLKGIGIIGIDQQKKDKPVLPTSGGVPVVMGFLLAGLFFLAANVFITGTAIKTGLVLAALLSALIAAMVGFFDDLNVKKEKKKRRGLVGYREGLKQWLKPLLTLTAALPLIAASAGVTSMNIPFIGAVNFGLWYPLLLIPIGVVVVTNATNMLAGLNGLEAGLVAVASLSLGLYALSLGRIEAAAIALTGFSCLLAFLIFNWYPARLLPGDSLTYFAGGFFVSAAIIGNMEKFAVFIFIPWIIEAFLKVRGKLNVKSYGKLQKNGTIKAPYKKIYSLPHVAMKLPYWLGKKKGFREWEASLLLILVEAAICLIAFGLFYFKGF